MALASGMTRFQLIHDDLTCHSEDGTAKATAHLEGHYVVVVHADSTAKGDWRTNERLLKQGVIKRDGDLFRFLVDFAYQSPHAASQFVTGDTRLVAWDTWKSASGVTLRNLFKNAGWLWLIEGEKLTKPEPRKFGAEKIGEWIAEDEAELRRFRDANVT